MIFYDKSMAQLVIEPNAPDDYTLEAILRGGYEMKRLKYGSLTILRARILRHLHPIVHHFVRWKSFDATSKRLVDVGYVCAHCQIGVLR